LPGWHWTPNEGHSLTAILKRVPTVPLGLLAHTMSNLDQAATHLEDALAFCRKAGYRPELAWTCCDYADAILFLSQRKPTGDPFSGQNWLFL